MKKKVLVAMSGGVDSAFTAFLLQEQGYDVSGITMIVSSDEPAQEAAVLAKKMGIPHEIVELKGPFRQYVVDYFLKEYQLGHTPNPCVLCNQSIKFGLLYRFREKLGCDYFATGHYVQLNKDHDGSLALFKAQDREKDQSYFLYALDPAIFPYLLFPLGGYSKAVVKQKAASFGLVPKEKEESQDICFIPAGDYRQFLRKAGCDDPPGDFVDRAGRVLGRHAGIPYYTVGQRKGLGIALGYPAYVIAIDPIKNQIVLGEEEELYSHVCYTEENHFHFHWPEDAVLVADVKLRYKSEPALATLSYADEQVKIDFFVPQKAIAPGQAAVFYNGDRLLGGGIIQK